MNIEISVLVPDVAHLNEHILSVSNTTENQVMTGAI